MALYRQLLQGDYFFDQVCSQRLFDFCWFVSYLVCLFLTLFVCFLPCLFGSYLVCLVLTLFVWFLPCLFGSYLVCLFLSCRCCCLWPAKQAKSISRDYKAIPFLSVCSFYFYFLLNTRSCGQTIILQPSENIPATVAVVVLLLLSLCYCSCRCAAVTVVLLL